MYENLLLVISALSLHLSLYVPSYFFWLTFFWVTPIFYYVLKRNDVFSFKQGFLWGMIFYFFNLYPITRFLMSESPSASSLLFSFSIILYTSLHSGIWFWFSKKGVILNGYFQAQKIISWTFFTCAYLLFLPCSLLWASGSSIGYPFCFPLLPLATHPRFLWLLHICGREILVFFQVCFSMSVALFLVSLKKIYFILVFIFLVPFFIGFFMSNTKKNIPIFFKQCGHIRPPDENEFSHPLDAAQEIYLKMRMLLKKHPQVKQIFLPELSYRFPLNNLEYVVELWNNNLLKNEIQLFIGAYRKEGNKIFNSLYHIKNGKIEKTYDKQLLMPFVEYIPKFFEKICFFKKLFLHERGQFSHGEKKCLFDCCSSINYLPYICSDFFLGSLKNKNDGVILLIFNDTIFFSTAFNNLIFLWNKFRAMEENKNVICVGNKEALFVSPYESTFRLKFLDDIKETK